MPGVPSSGPAQRLLRVELISSHLLLARRWSPETFSLAADVVADFAGNVVMQNTPRAATAPSSVAVTPPVDLHRRATASAALSAALLAGAMLPACSGGASAPQVPGGETIVDGPSFFFTDPNFGGAATEFRMVSVTYGRLVRLFGLDAQGRRVAMGDDFVVSDSLVGDGVDYTLESNAVTGQENLTILRDVDDAAGMSQFVALARAAGEDLSLIQVRDLGGSLFSLMPRNAAVVVRFDDLLLPSSIDDRTLQLVTGVPPSQPFEPRVFPLEYYGGTAGDGSFYPTRVVIDLTVSSIEASASSTAIPVNPTGLPPSLTVTDANAQLRVATRALAAVGITRVLTNLTGHPLATDANGPVDLVAPTRPVTRAFRSGGRPDIIQDPYNGFLRDEQPPVVVGSTPVTVSEAPEQLGGPGSRLFRLPRLAFASELCAATPSAGDALVQPGVVAEVVQDGSPPIGGEVEGTVVRLVLHPPTWDGPADWELFGVGDGSFEMPFDPLADATRVGCFVQVAPRPAGFPELPVTGLATSSTLSLRFSEPMDRRSMTAFDSLSLTREPIPEFGGLASSDYVVGRLSRTIDLRGVTFVPDQPLAHRSGTAENYFLTLTGEGGTFPPRDLAGNVVDALPGVELQIDPSQPSEINGGRVSRLTSIDEEFPFEGRPEWGGQIFFDAQRELIRPRPIVRTQAVIDRSQPIIAQMTTFTAGVVTPFSGFGSKMQTIWRYADCGFSLTDPQNMNIDIEGINWAPVGGSITPDAFAEFEMRLAHSRFAPDEVVNPGSLLPQYPASGLRGNFAGNPLQGSPQATVHPRELGYTLDMGDLFQSSTGTTLMPFPLNRGVPLAERTYYTWRDTSIRERGGPLIAGVDPRSYLIALGLPLGTPFQRANQVQSTGLPLLMEFRTYPDSNAIGQNAWSLNLAINSSANPFFRAYSTGGVSQSSGTAFVDPEMETFANGGFNPGSTPPGAITPGRDNSVHVGALDHVTRVSRAHSIWFESTIEGETSFTTRRYRPPTVEPQASDQPDGTNIDIDFRGALDIVYSNTGNYLTDNDSDNNGIVDYAENAFLIDLYGDYYNEVDGPLDHGSAAMNPGLNFHGSEPEQPWRESAAEIADARYYQVRLTFRGNAATGRTPELSAFAMTWSRD